MSLLRVLSILACLSLFATVAEATECAKSGTGVWANWLPWSADCATCDDVSGPRRERICLPPSVSGCIIRHYECHGERVETQGGCFETTTEESPADQTGTTDEPRDQVCAQWSDWSEPVCSGCSDSKLTITRKCTHPAGCPLRTRCTGTTFFKHVGDYCGDATKACRITECCGLHTCRPGYNVTIDLAERTITCIAPSSSP